MAISKVTYAGNTLIDLTGDTVTPENLLSGATAHAANGEKITGIVEDKTGQLAKNIAQIETAGTATNAHSVGEYVMISNALYKVTAAVAKGDAWTIGTNVSAANVGSEINALVSKTDNMKASFQAGVDGIYNAITAQGTTPASKSQSDVQAAIPTLANNSYNKGYANGKNGASFDFQRLWYDTTHNNSTGYTLSRDYDIAFAVANCGGGKQVSYRGQGTVYTSVVPNEGGGGGNTIVIVVGAKAGGNFYANTSWYNCSVYGGYVNK